MPVRIGAGGKWQVIEPTTAWKTMPTSLTKDDVEVATDLYYVNVVEAVAMRARRRRSQPDLGRAKDAGRLVRETRLKLSFRRFTFGLRSGP